MATLTLAVVLAGALGGCPETAPVEAPRLPWPSSPVPCDREGFAPVWERVSWTPNDQGGAYIRYEARDQLTEPFNELLVEFYADDTFKGPSTPGTYALDGSNYIDCGLCVRLRTGCYGAWCDETYFGGEGTVELTAIGPPATGETAQKFEATFTGLGLRATTIAATAVSTTLPESAGWCLPTYSVSTVVESPGAGTACTPLGTGTTLGEGIGDFTLTNCLGEPVRLHERCGGARATLIVASAGWCVPCKIWLPEAVSQWEQRRDQGLDLLVVLGEDSSGGAPTLDYCAAYAAAHNIPPENLVIDHGPRGPWQTLFSHVHPYVSGGMVTLPWNAVLAGRNMAYAWTDAANEGEVFEAVDDALSAP